ncbi:hypothetical protein [Acinetobacter stercoris]|uniref:hypothetical protein n=1 Tax=Acinetobacter stercoris TaxID=2126983 RepID=UPI0011B219E8|nr:hypothetical protein [Acinetobacter stercoris]
MINHLQSYSGYDRQWALEQAKYHYEKELFPLLLLRLSDHVPINQDIAKQRIIEWSQRKDFSKLCIDYFLDVAMTQIRLRSIDEINQLIFYKIQEDTSYFKFVLISSQGKLPRALLAYAVRTKCINHEGLIAWSSKAKDQLVRALWLNSLIENQNIDALKKIG